MTKDEARQTVSRLREILERGATLRQAAAETGTPKSTLHDLAVRANLPRRRRAIPQETQRRLTRSLSRDESVRVIARLVKISKSTVQRQRQKLRGTPGGPQRVAAYRCGGCQTLVNLRPCVICAARTAGRGPAGP